MRFSVIVSTLDRAGGLRVLLRALAHQTDPDFEVVVVTGPSTDDTAAVLAEYAGRVRAFDCPVANRSLARNIGIAAAAGDICAFIDDDGVPEPQWIADMRAGFTGPDVAAVGGVVYDHTGHRLENVIGDRSGNATANVPPPLTPYQLQAADPYLHLPGGNASYRRDVLAAVGGFDEEIESDLDAAELCLRLNDRGFWLTQSPRAAVLHQSAPSHGRDARPYLPVKDKLYFCLQAARAGGRDLAPALDEGTRFADLYRERGRHRLADGTFTPAEYEQYEADIQRAVRDGTERGVSHDRKGRAVPPADPTQFWPFPTRTAADRLTVCLISRVYPPEPVAGVGQYMLTLAGGLSDAGHEVHVVASSPDRDRVDFEDGVWVHRVVPQYGQFEEWAAAAHAEVRRLAATRPVDVVHACAADAEGVYCHLDDDLRTVLTLTPASVPDLTNLERVAVRATRTALAPSRKVAASYEVAADVVPFGVDDRAGEFDRSRGADDRVRVLTVGRLDHLDGTDVVLAAAAELCPEFPEVEFVLAGADDEYRAAFARRHAGETWADRVAFRGPVADDELWQEYADCDIVCLPARSVSFGREAVVAMQFGRPVVGGPADVIDDGVTGLLAYPGSVGSLARCLRELLADPDKRDRFGLAARGRYEAAYSTAAMTRDTVRAYRRAG